jgi:diaminohydroxyphosphoribosylaminopyrimidine deaminase/5-amino-6-(5-phosphoribosylamino)uracil reductase
MAAAIEVAVDSKPHPNPRVGAVVVAPNGELLSSGFHSGPGSPHAEVVALVGAGHAAQGATLVVTLEPCNHQGRTPPCTEAILSAGIQTVVVGALDPDTRVRGGGISRLREAGVTVVDLDDPAARALDLGYFHHRETGMPRVTLKSAMTLDGQVAARDGTSQWITSGATREDAHRLRAASDAVMVGAGTLLEDDPRLDVRLLDPKGPQPRPVVVAGRRELPVAARLFGRDPIVYATQPQALPGGEMVVVGRTGSRDLVSEDDRVDLGAVLKDLGARDTVDLLVEGGPTLAGALWSAGLVDRVVFYVGAKLAGGAGRGVFGRAFETLGDARDVAITDVTRIGDDLRIEAIPLKGGG